MKQKTIQIDIEGMTCEDCARTIEKALKLPGVIEKKVGFTDRRARVSFDPGKIDPHEIARRINEIGPYRAKNIKEIGEPNNRPKQVIIIGGGSAAFAAALRAHELGSHVTMINAGLPIGGTCVNVGCVPSKNLIRAAEELHRSQKSRFPGITKEGRLSSFADVIQQKREMVLDLRQEKYTNVIANMEDVELIEGRGQIVSPTTVRVNGKTLSADAIILATGASPRIPPIPGLDDVPYLTNASAFELETLPEHLIVLGGNYIGIETAQLFARLGSRVTVVELLPQILPTETHDLTEELKGYLAEEGIQFMTNARTERIYQKGKEIYLDMDYNKQHTQIHGTHLLVATGRKPNTEGLGLEKVGVDVTPSGAVHVNEYLESTVPGIFAAGDVIGGFMFVYTAAYEGKLAVDNILSGEKQAADYRALPWVIFTDPQVAGVGLNEPQAQAQGIDAESVTLPLKYVPHSIAARDMRGFIRLIRNKQTNQLVGARILAPGGAELLMEVAMAIKWGITVEQLKDMFHPYLTLSEGIKLAAIGFTKDIKTLSCCAT
ncbi:MAG: mercury(II) reductase [Calditrichaeota bacterium]|nr:mercury(II) reductase [Calditrichota bacterium]